MTRYLMSVCYAADATPHSPEELEHIMEDVSAVRSALQAEGCVGVRGLPPPSHHGHRHRLA